MRMNIWVSGQGRQYRHVCASYHATQRQHVLTNVLGGKKIYESYASACIKPLKKTFFKLYILQMGYICLMTGSVIFSGGDVDSLPFRSA